MTLSDRLKASAPTVLRIGVALVFLWFGSQQLMHPGSWLGFIPKSIMDISGLTAPTLVAFNGSFEIVFGLCLLAGFFTRVSALLLALHMLDITYVVGYGATGVRDFGLSIAAVAVFLYGIDKLCLDRRFTTLD